MPASAELFTLLTPHAALARLMANWNPVQRVDEIDTADALGRVLAADIRSREDLPAFRRSTVDGYAVRAIDTHGASAGLPALLTVTGEAPMGQVVAMPLHSGEAVLVHTGSMLPADADAVVMIEHTQVVDSGQRAEDGRQRAEDRGPASDRSSVPPSVLSSPSSVFRPLSIEVSRPVAAGENVLQVGEDARAGAQVYAAGQRVRPADIGGLMALGVTRVRVAARPRVGIISTGDEVIDPSRTPAPGQVRDVNAYALAAQAQAASAEAVRYGIVPDQREALEAVARRAHAECDMVVLSAGSSVSARDMSVEVIGALGAPGVLVHGVSVKPGKPAILAVCADKPVFGLPGNPASAMLIFDLFVAPAIDALLGAPPRRTHTVRARLSRNVPSSTGREDYVQVNLEQRGDELWATPIFGKSNLIYTLVRADGRVKIDLDANGVRAGEWVDVQL